MKKSIIAAGAASVALAAMPVVGVFAADGNAGNIDNLEVTIDSACSLTAADSQTTHTYNLNVTNGNTASTEDESGKGTVLTIKCNDNGGWQLNARGTGDATTATSLKASAGTDIATGSLFSGATSAWGMKVTGDKALSAYSADYTSVPATDTPVAADTNETDMENGTTVTTNYKVYASQSQEAGTYTGQVTYTLVHPKANS